MPCWGVGTGVNAGVGVGIGDGLGVGVVPIVGSGCSRTGLGSATPLARFAASVRKRTPITPAAKIKDCLALSFFTFIVFILLVLDY